MKIVTDSSVMYTVKEGHERGMTVLPLTVTVDHQNWAEYEEISSDEFLKKIYAGSIPTSSSPLPASTVKAYGTDDEVLHITMADGLSGAYEVASGLKNQARHPERVRILNSKTLCIPQRILALQAVQLASKKVSFDKVVEQLQEMMDTAHSYLIPDDFDFLRRGGRLTPLAATFVSVLKAVPVLKQTTDGKRLERLAITRSPIKAVDKIIKELKEYNIGKDFFISISHADNNDFARMALEKIKEHFPVCRTGVFNLGPAFITQGGPRCVAIQVISLGSSPDLSIA